MKASGFVIGLIAGAAAGAVLGFVWGQGTRSAIGDATTTTYSGGKITVQIDAGQAAKAGLAGLLG